MDSALFRPLMQLTALILFFIVPLFNLFRIDLVHQHFYLLTRKFSFNEGYILLMIILTLVFTFVSISQWFGRQFCGWLCPHNTFSGYLIRVTKWTWLKSDSARNTLDFLLSILFAPIIAFCLLAYFITPYDIWQTITSGNLLNMTGISFIVSTLIFFVMINRLRYRFCQNACPYGMLQMILSNGNQKRSIVNSMFSGVGLVLVAVMTALVSLTLYFVINSSGFTISVAKKIDGVPSGNQIIYSYDLTIENLRDRPVHYTVKYEGLPKDWQSSVPTQIDLRPSEIKSIPLVFRINDADLGKNYIVEVEVTSDSNKSLERKLTIFPVRK